MLTFAGRVHFALASLDLFVLLPLEILKPCEGGAYRAQRFSGARRTLQYGDL